MDQTTNRFDTNTLTVYAYAKINLTLDVFNLRSDGYHSLASVMQSIALFDTVTLTRLPERGVRFACTGDTAEEIPADSSNTVVRAAELLLEAAHREDGVSIQLHKQVPSQAGLGGGSSDAAATLLGLITLMGLDVGPRLAHDLAAQIGSDVPFFLSGGTAVARGRGESISPIADCPPFWLVVVKPDENVSTGSAYGWLDAQTERLSSRATARMEAAIREGEAERIPALMSNDFEATVFAQMSKLAWLRDELQMAGSTVAHLCGSGSAVYGAARSEAHAQQIAARMRPLYSRTYIGRTLSRVEANPLRELQS